MSSAAVTGAIVAPRTVAAVVPPPAGSSSTSAKYRGAVVEDMQLPPAVAVPRNATVQAALSVAHDHDYSQLPLVSTTDRKLLGYVDVAVLSKRLAEGSLIGSDPVDSAMNRFANAAPSTAAGASGGSGGGGRTRSTFTVIDPNTGLGELETFLQNNPFALVTDPSRSFVMAVATREDLNKFVVRRGLGGGSGNAALESHSAPLTRREEEEARKDRTLAQFMLMLDDYKPLIPDEVTDYYLEKVGFECDDARLKRFLSLAAEKFVSDIAADAFQYARIRTNAGPAGKPKGSGPAGAAGGGAGPGGVGAGSSGGANQKDRSRTVLTMDDLSAALGEYGINARRAEWHR
ncbi:unnamed protein product [Tilletia controversa]|uniref:CBS domain-containing protein n=3 Tax=Tilletia TaxID=13289 RepID=A0A8X7MLF4_9BASI|nr:hypothetical protein CF336_g6771 [Tilletia laevis]KAE8187426.1 hypothetical protein CF328_g6921 [Tilletia controversa]KAE8251762.1 hypothetical protein A4X03_0g6319 [Tilletia caries]KAE8191700.1 hypothetical protein CF335_g6015 [Tilletia laevis]KAE8241106.1 hypothetical protein A4X06_0g7665 [Tilletia controversa]